VFLGWVVQVVVVAVVALYMCVCTRHQHDDYCSGVVVVIVALRLLPVV